MNGNNGELTQMNIVAKIKYQHVNERENNGNTTNFHGQPRTFDERTVRPHGDELTVVFR